jgi:adenosylcobinamide-phosphate synthase
VSAQALGLLAGYLADRLIGDPATRHPVAAFGRLAQRVEQRWWADDRRVGVTYAAALVGGAAAAGRAIERVTQRHPWLRLLTTATVTWAVLGGRSLMREAHTIATQLATDDLSAARRQLTHLVGRDTDTLDELGIARATIESVAENTSDAVVAPLLAGAVAGVPGLMAYRAANTLDAMVGHRSARHAHFGWASARLDDALNWVPARVTALLAVLLAPAVGGRSSVARQIWLRDAPGHPSPNAGPVEAAFAGALGVQLGGINSYGGRVEDRHTLGDGPSPTRSDIEVAAHLATLISHGAAAAAVTVALAKQRRHRRR